MDKKTSAILGLVIGLVLFSGSALANTFLPNFANYVLSNHPTTNYNYSSATCASGGPYYEPPFNFVASSNSTVYFDFSTDISGNGLYPNSTISDAQLCWTSSGESHYSFSSYGYSDVHDIFPNVTLDFGDDYTNNQTWNTQICGPNINNGTYCNTTAYMSKTITAVDVTKGDNICYNITSLAQYAINNTGAIRVALHNHLGGYVYLYTASFYCPFNLDPAFNLPRVVVSCNGTYADFYNGTSDECYTVDYTTTTTISSTATATYDWLNSTTTWLGNAIGSDSTGGKFVIWLAISLVVSMFPMVYKLTKDFKMAIIILIAMMLLGVVVGWIPAWVGITFVVIASLLIAKFATNIFS